MGKKLTGKENKTVGYYDKNAKTWASDHSKIKKFWGGMHLYNKLLPRGRKVLEIGCGGGRDAHDYLIGRYDYTGTDISEGLLQEARRNNPKGKFLKRSVYGLSFPNDTFDGFWASAVLLHVPKRRIGEALREIHNVVKDNGVGFISLKKGRGEREEKGGRWFAYYSEKEFGEILARNGFKLIEFYVLPMSKKTTWLVWLVEVEKK